MKIGAHVSISGGIQNSVMNAAEIGCETFQIFTQNQRQWKSKIFSQDEIEAFKSSRRERGYNSVPLLSHASYLINMCAADENNLQRSRKALVEELRRCDQLGINYLVIHPGAHGGKGEEWGIAVISETINETLSRYQPQVEILLETTAGSGTAVGYRFEHLQKIIEQVDDKSKAAVCLDTCHIFAAGYSIQTKEGWESTFSEIEQSFGWEKLKAFHLNDSLKELASRRDRHAAIGEGYIGLKSFECIVNHERLKDTPGIIEIPANQNADKDNIKLLKSLRFE